MPLLCLHAAGNFRLSTTEKPAFFRAVFRLLPARVVVRLVRRMRQCQATADGECASPISPCVAFRSVNRLRQVSASLSGGAFLWLPKTLPPYPFFSTGRRIRAARHFIARPGLGNGFLRMETASQPAQKIAGPANPHRHSEVSMSPVPLFRPGAIAKYHRLARRRGAAPKGCRKADGRLAPQFPCSSALVIDPICAWKYGAHSVSGPELRILTSAYLCDMYHIPSVRVFSTNHGRFYL